MKLLWLKMRNYLWTQYRINMIMFALMLGVGTCQIVPNYAILEGEIRFYRGNELGVYLGGF